MDLQHPVIRIFCRHFSFFLTFFVHRGDQDLAVGAIRTKLRNLSILFLLITDRSQIHREEQVKCMELWSTSMAKLSYRFPRILDKYFDSSSIETYSSLNATVVHPKNSTFRFNTSTELKNITYTSTTDNSGIQHGCFDYELCRYCLMQ